MKKVHQITEQRLIVRDGWLELAKSLIPSIARLAELGNETTRSENSAANPEAFDLLGQTFDVYVQRGLWMQRSAIEMATAPMPTWRR